MSPFHQPVRLKPRPDVFTDALHFDGTPASAASIVEWAGDRAAYREGELLLNTADGWHTCPPGEWALMDPKGRPYPVDADVVVAKYVVVGS